MDGDIINTYLKEHPEMTLGEIERSRPSARGGGFAVRDMEKVKSACTKENQTGFLSISMVLHADKKRTIPLLRSMGLQYRPTDLLRYGSMGSISYSGQNVKIVGRTFPEILYVDPDKNRTDTWTKQLGLQLPPHVTSCGFIHSISASDQKSNTDISKERQGGAWQKNSATEGGGARHSIKYDWNNTPYVVIGANILDGVPKNKWV